MAILSFNLSRYEASIDRLRDEVLFGLHMNDEILKMFPPRDVVHRGASRLVSRPNILDKSMIPHKSAISLDKTMFLKSDVAKCTEVIWRECTSLLDQQRTTTVNVMLETGGAAGNSVDGNGKDVWELYIEMLNRLDHRFEGFKFLVGSDVIKKMLAKPLTEEQLERAKAVVEIKREEFQANKRVRRLVEE